MSTVGFRPASQKIASIAAEATTFELRRADDATVVFDAALGESFEDYLSKDVLRIADFSEFEELGTYVVHVEGLGDSVPFRIAGDAYQSAFASVMLGFYGWRADVDIAFEHEGQAFAHAKGVGEALLDELGAPGELGDSAGGWYDAGDYGRYTLNGAFSAGMMLRAWEDFREGLEAAELQNVDEEGIPDFLAEVKFELDWLLKMQVPELDGRISNKVSPLAYGPATELPEDLQPLYFAPPSTSATASFAAVMAQGARVFEEFDADLATTYREAAVRSYAYLTDNPDEAVDSHFGNTSDYTSTAGDDRVWAAAEIWRTTGDEAALAEFETRAIAARYQVDATFDWTNLWMLGVSSYMTATGDAAEARNADTVTKLQDSAVETGNSLLLGASRNYGYGNTISRFLWGSNGEHLRTCFALTLAYRVVDDPAYLHACEAMLAYVFGHNRYGRSQVTGVGYGPPLHPHHRLSQGDQVCRPYPGLIVGGYSDGHPWQDTATDFFTNEVAINWNAALVYALAGFLEGEATEVTAPGEPAQNCDPVTSAAPNPVTMVPPAAAGAGATSGAAGAGGSAAVPPTGGRGSLSGGCQCASVARRNRGFELGGATLAALFAMALRRKRRVRQ